MTSDSPGGFYLDELRFRAVRDVELLKPGELVIFAHVPDLNKSGYGTNPYGRIVTIREVRTEEVDYGLGSEEAIKIHYFDKNGEDETYASDRGVVPYPAGHFSEVNFVVLVSDLVAAGLEIKLDVSDEYKAHRQYSTYGYSVDDTYDVPDPYDDYY